MGAAYSLSYICAKLFFARVVVKNQHKVPSKGPLIFVANHRNMILDPGMVRYSCGRTGYYLAKHTLFMNKIQNWVFRHAGAIPVYRKQDDPKMTSKNKDTFESGAARIALNAEKRNDFNLDLKIIPIGLNYSDASRFKSDVYIKYGDPISLDKYKNHIDKDFLFRV